MFRLSKRCEYSLMALFHLDGLPPGGVVSARELAARYEIPVELLGKVLQALTRAGLVESEHGAQGGYRLAVSLDRVTLGEMMEAVEGPLHLVRCLEKASPCGQRSHCAIRGPALRIQEELSAYLATRRLNELKATAR